MLKTILEVVLNEFDVTEADLHKLGANGKISRKREYVQPRQVYYTVCRLLNPSIPFASIGWKFKQDHATVCHAIKTCANICATDKQFRERFERVLTECQNIAATGEDYLQVELQRVLRKFIDRYATEKNCTFVSWAGGVSDWVVFDNHSEYLMKIIENKLQA